MFDERQKQSCAQKSEGTAATAPSPKVIDVRPAGDDHEVVTVEGGKRGYCKKPCPSCPWRKDAVGSFPAEAFRLSAATAYDMSDRIFACHTAGHESPRICAGFLLRGSEHNLSVRLQRMKGEIGEDVSDGGHPLHESYREMAISNGVDEDDAVLLPCR